MSEEVFLPHAATPDRVPMASSVRGTVLLGSVRGLRTRGLYDRYLEMLEPKWHETIASLTAGTWLPIDLAMAHYAACDALKLDRDTIEAIGRESGLFVNGTVLSAVAKISATAGVTPWFPLSNAHKLQTRTWVGSSIAIYKLGPKEARFEWIQLPVARFAYMRAGFAAFAGAIGGLFTSKMVVRDMDLIPRSSVVTYRMSWA